MHGEERGENVCTVVDREGRAHRSTGNIEKPGTRDMRLQGESTVERGNQLVLTFLVFVKRKIG